MSGIQCVKCEACGKWWSEHPGCQVLCAENQRLKKERDAARHVARWLYESDGDAHSKADARHRWPWLEEEE